ncbi:hypothetical protein KC19_4G121300 [Ceratodon purpureus]|uniref:Uncharacterized protein n=1 Tax=Ceratodon purpureus TaxID=3225 RepID=A0A8T0IBE3_CERPU|nr:hypothetical protein KC19_4G121300 [Ceratodon purpureus]
MSRASAVAHKSHDHSTIHPPAQKRNDDTVPCSMQLLLQITSSLKTAASVAARDSFYHTTISLSINNSTPKVDIQYQFRRYHFFKCLPVQHMPAVCYFAPHFQTMNSNSCPRDTRLSITIVSS